jgi:hypothetical protein
MEKMLTEVCHEVNNYFRRDSIRINLSVSDHTPSGIPDGFLQEGQFFLIEGSIFNDGVHKWLASGTNLRDEQECSCNVWSLAIPQEFLDLVAEISAWNEVYGGATSAALSPFASESFGGYSYSKSSGGSSSDGSADGSNWKTAYASRLNKWRRVRGIV